MYVILIIILTNFQQSWRIFAPFFSIQYLLTDDWIDFKLSSSYSSFFCVLDKQSWPSIDWAPLPVYPPPPPAHCSLVAAPIIFSDHFLDLFFFNHQYNDSYRHWKLVKSGIVCCVAGCHLCLPMLVHRKLNFKAHNGFLRENIDIGPDGK